MTRVVVVDDEVAVAKAVVRMVERLGHAAERATSAVEALQLVSQHRPHVVITDVQMPLMDGLTLVREIHQRLGPESPAFVIVSACDLPGSSISKELRWRFLAKPFHLKELAGALQDVLAT